MANVALARRLANLRRETRGTEKGEPWTAAGAAASQSLERRSAELAAGMAASLGGELVATDRGSYIRIAGPRTFLPIDRVRLAGLPGQPGPDVPLVCLDTETTGLATAAGTIAFLVGIGCWRGDVFHQVQLLLPDHSDEPAFLAGLADQLPSDGWLVTYNGRCFDWPLLVARYRMARRPPPAHAGHLDLLGFVRAIFRHRLDDARLRTVERDLLGVARAHDVEGWEIPGRYIDVLRGGPVAQLSDVVRHNDEDVRSLARLLTHIEQRFGGPLERAVAPSGDLVGLARAFRRERALEASLECLDAAWAGHSRGSDRSPGSRPWLGRWSPDRPPAGRQLLDAQMHRRERDRIGAERARLLRRIGRDAEAIAAWRDLALGGGPLSAVAWIEVAKALEHRCHDPGGALDAVEAAAALAERSRRLGRAMPRLEQDLARRRRRLAKRLSSGAVVADRRARRDRRSVA